MIMLRLIPTSVHTIEDVDYTVKAFTKIKENLDKGKYSGAMASMVIK